MAVDLKRKVGPLPLWGWVVIGGGTIGMIILVKRGKTTAPASTESEPIPSSLQSPFGPEAGGVGGGGFAPGPAEAKAPEAIPANNTPAEHTPVSDFLTTERELEEGGWHRAQPPSGVSAAPAGASGSTAPGTHAARVNTAGGNPRKGLAYKTGKYKGMAAHIYQHAVHGGVGPKHNIIVLSGAHGGKTHAAKPNHAPAHVKAKHKPTPAHHAPVHHNAKPTHPRHHPPAKRKAKARRR